MTETEQRLLLYQEVGFQIIAEYAKLPILDIHRGTPQFPRCPHCRRRPTFVAGRRVMLQFKTGLPDPPVVQIPRYEIIPCCSANYIKVNEGPTRKQKLAAKHAV